MPDQKQPKVILFDIGGVCVASPFQAILDYELSLGIPPGWVNYSISKSAPNGFWHRLERGEIPLDEAFYAGFNRELRDADKWQAFYSAAVRARSSDKDLPGRQGALPPVPEVDGKRMFDEMMAVSDQPDPWMFPALQALRASGRYVLAALSNTVVFPPGHRQHHASYDEYLSDHPVRRYFDVFVSSAHVGLRKPEPSIYQLALREADRFERTNADTPRGRSAGWSGQGVVPGDILFLDDIGENLKEARRQGFRTLKVNLGRAYEAVDVLEAITGLALAGNHPRPPRSDVPSRARI